jgi:predicted restriction endonuclease
LKDDDIDALVKLSQQSVSKMTNVDIAKLDKLTRERPIEDIENLIQLYAQKQLSKTPEQVTKLVTSFKRNIGMVNVIKRKFGSRCQICGFTFKTSSGSYYSEAAHVIPISKAVEGVDSPDNIWILCPNHHKMLDKGAIIAKDQHSYIENNEIKELLKY